MASTSETNPCAIQGNTDMYGIGIRLGFYLQWYASTAAAWVAPSEVSGLRTANAMFVSATFLALIVQVTTEGLDIAEIYIILLLTFGAFYFQLPLMLWRLATRFNPDWDPTRWSKMKKPSEVFYVLLTLVEFAVFGFQLWFWAKKIPDADTECQRYGFVFAQVHLNSLGFRVFNLVITALMLPLLLFFFVAKYLGFEKLLKQKHKRQVIIPEDYVRSTGEEWDEQAAIAYFIQAEKKRLKKRIRKLRIADTIIRFILISIIVIGTELTIHWNAIEDINVPGTAGQLIPLVIGAAAVGHVILTMTRGEPKKGEEKEGDQDEDEDEFLPAFYVITPLSMPDPGVAPPSPSSSPENSDREESNGPKQPSQLSQIPATETTTEQYKPVEVVVSTSGAFMLPTPYTLPPETIVQQPAQGEPASAQDVPPRPGPSNPTQLDRTAAVIERYRPVEDPGVPFGAFDVPQPFHRKPKPPSLTSFRSEPVSIRENRPQLGPSHSTTEDHDLV